MKLRFLGKNSTPGDSPTLYASDRDSYVVQGWKVLAADLLMRLDVPDGHTVVEVPTELFEHLTKDGLPAGEIKNCERPRSQPYWRRAVELITSAQRDELFGSFARDAFHLELRDDYGSPVEDTPYARWQRGEPDDYAWLDPWMTLMKRVPGEGKTVRRVRVVTEPHSQYVEWEHSLTRLNTEAGEDIRWLPRHRLPEGIAFPVAGNDWWLFDDRLLAVGYFDAEGRVLGSELVTDPGTVAECVRVRDRLWSIAVPHPEYKP